MGNIFECELKNNNYSKCVNLHGAEIKTVVVVKNV